MYVLNCVLLFENSDYQFSKKCCLNTNGTIKKIFYKLSILQGVCKVRQVCAMKFNHIALDIAQFLCFC